MVGKEHIIELKQFINEYSFRLDDIPETEIIIRIYKYMDHNLKDKYTFTISHNIKTPLLSDSYKTSITIWDSEDKALDFAINTITENYQVAIEQGYIPQNDWLVKNKW